MVVLPPSYRRPASTVMPVRFQDLWGDLEGDRSTHRNVIDPSIRSRSMDPRFATWGLQSSGEVSITTWGTILILFLLIVIYVRTMIWTRTSRRRRAAFLRKTEEAGVYICQGRQRRARATLKIDVDLEDSSGDSSDFCQQSPIDIEAPPPYDTTVPHADSGSSVPPPSAAFAASYGRQYVRPRLNSNAYIRITVLVATPSDTTDRSLGSSRHSRLCGVLGDLTDSEASDTDSECSSTYSDSEDEWDRLLPPLPLSPSAEEVFLRPHLDFALAHTQAIPTVQGKR